MADDTMRRRHDAAARAFIVRRRDLGLTQEQVAQRAGIVVRTVSNFENGRWPNAHSKMMLEEAVGWAPGEIERIADRAVPVTASPRLRAQIEREFDGPTAARILAYIDAATEPREEGIRAVNGGRS